MTEPKVEYILITPAHNEEKFIENIIKSVISQTRIPKKWVIVNDGSIDRTDEIIKKYLNKYNWIEYIKLTEHKDRQFAAKVFAFNVGYEKVKNLKYQIIGNLDADVSFESDYFEFLISKFEKDKKLGVAGTAYFENNVFSEHGFVDLNHVHGMCQMFRKECFERIGGYVPVKQGGIDWIAVTTARMNGWKTQTFTKKTFNHHRGIGTGRKGNVLISRFNYGQKDYFLGGHFLWEIFRFIFQMSKKPYIIGGIMLFLGYLVEMFKFKKRPISKELIKFHQSEQINRLKKLLFKK